MKHILFLVVFLTIVSFHKIYSQEVDKRGQKSKELFEATNEWKEIKEGQTVPSGLHYRINLSTGKKEARILQKEDEQTQREHQGILTTDFEVLKQLNNPFKPSSKIVKPNQFRTIEEIRSQLGEINLQPKSDFELMHELFSNYENLSKNNNREDNNLTVLTLLQDFNYLGHQFDNGNEFCQLNGFRRIIYKELNSTEVEIRREALKLFAVLTQNNPKVKVHVLESGGISILLRLLNLEKDVTVKSSALTALSCTLRTFPYAQNKFLEMGGLEISTDLFKSESIRLKVKVVTLLHDLIVERQKDVDNFDKKDFINIEENLFKLGWCSDLSDLLQDLITVDASDVDSIEKCLLAMDAIADKCKSNINKIQLVKLKHHYEVVIKNDNDGESFYKYLVDLLLVLIKKLDILTPNVEL